MSAESVRAFMASAAPDLEIVELPASSQTHTLSAAWGIRAAQIAKTLARIAPDRMAVLSGAQWVDICVVTRQGPVDRALQRCCTAMVEVRKEA